MRLTDAQRSCHENGRIAGAQQPWMSIDDLGPEALWRCYQVGYNSLMKSGAYFRQLLRTEMSHAFFQKALPLLQEYAIANKRMTDPAPGFRDRLEACPLSPRDLLHLDYAICLGYTEMRGLDPEALVATPVMEWPGPPTNGAPFIAVDAMVSTEVSPFESDDQIVEMGGDDGGFDRDPEEGGGDPPFDL